MALSYRDLVAAGAPELPGQMFYRVKLKDERGFVGVEIRAPWIIGSQLIARRLRRVDPDAPALAQVVELATEAANAVRVGLGFVALVGDARKEA